MFWCLIFTKEPTPSPKLAVCLPPLQTGKCSAEWCPAYRKKGLGEFQSHHFQIRGENIENIFEGKWQKRLSVFEGHLKSCNTHGVFIRCTFKKYLWKSFEWQNIQGQWPFLTEHNRATLHPIPSMAAAVQVTAFGFVSAKSHQRGWEWVTHYLGGENRVNRNPVCTETPELPRWFLQWVPASVCVGYSLPRVPGNYFTTMLLQPNELGYRSICNHCFCFSGILIS